MPKNSFTNLDENIFYRKKSPAFNPCSVFSLISTNLAEQQNSAKQKSTFLLQQSIFFQPPSLIQDENNNKLEDKELKFKAQ